LPIFPVYQIFGSEELSSASSSIAQRIQEPFVYLNQKDAELFGIEENDLIQLEIAEIRLRIKVIFNNSQRQGIAGLSVNLPGMQFIDLPGLGKFYKK
jgi:NADH-quinone oxidoreductase subunit G